MTQIIDRDGAATVASAQAQAALDAGDTERAQKQFAHAGKLLEQEMMEAKKDATEHLLRFLAATQFYKGGHYKKALELAEKIKAAKLPAATGHLLPKFIQDVKGRASPDYAARAHERLQALWTAQDYVGIIELLQEDQYIIPSADLAFIRAVCCEMLGKYRAAVLFFADAARRSQNNLAVLGALAPLPVNLLAEGKLAEAWEYTQAQMDLYPNPVSYAVATILCYSRAFEVEGDERASILDEQSQYFDRAREEYPRLSAAHQNNRVVREVIRWAYEARARALYRVGSMTTALKLCDAAIEFDPSIPSGWTLRGLILSSGAVEARLTTEATSAFKKAVGLGEDAYLPYYFFAHDAIRKGEYREALDWSKQSLARVEQQAPLITSLLYQWAAISLANLGGPREEIEAFFQKAIEVAPENELARRNYHHFQRSEVLEPPPFPSRPDIQHHEGVRFSPDRIADEVNRRLASVAE